MTARPMGAPIIPIEHSGRRVPNEAIGAEPAMREVVAAYLAGLVFSVHGGDRQIGRVFQFNEVFTEWPEPGLDLPYPCASVLFPAGTILERHNFTPTPLVETRDRFGDGSVLWKVGELTGELQIDAWSNTTPDRDAIRARLPGAFAPGENATNVLLTGHPRYWGLVVKASLVGFEDQSDTNQVYANERRLRVTVQASIEAVELRCTPGMDPRNVSVVIPFDDGLDA